MTATDLAGLIAEVRARPAAELVEPRDGKPYDIFVADLPGSRWVGRKAPARVTARPDAPRRKGCLVEADMLGGLLERGAATGSRVAARYRPLTDAEKPAVMAAFAGSPGHELRYPFARAAAGRADLLPDPAYWDPTPERVADLDAGEAVLREHAGAALRRHRVDPRVIYDAACSTGAFLAGLKRHYPDAVTIGQDLHAGMASYASRFADRVTVGDSIRPAVPPGGADLVVCRHLNLAVVGARRADALFRAALTACGRPGWLVLVGHTPILLSAAQMAAAGCQVVERSGTTPDRHAAFQFYLLRLGPPAGSPAARPAPAGGSASAVRRRPAAGPGPAG